MTLVELLTPATREMINVIIEIVACTIVVIPVTIGVLKLIWARR